MTKNAVFLVLLLPALWLACAAGAASRTAADARQELRELRTKIEALNKRLAAAEQVRSEAADALKDSERAISDASRRLRELAQQSQAVEQHVADLRAESRRGEEALKAQQESLAHLLYRQYVAGQPDPLQLLFNGEDPSEVARQLHYLTYVSRARADLIAELRAGLARLQDLAREAGEQAAELAAIAAEQAVQKRRLEHERQARSQVLTRIAKRIREQRREIGTLQQNEKRLTRLIDELARIVARKSPPPRVRNERLPDSSGDGGFFEQLKGRLRLPVRGELGNRFGSPRSGGGPAWKGLFIAAPTGEEVRAVAGGRVVFADWLRGFGNLLIIDHGGAYMSLYGNNETLYKRVGETTRGGEPIATVGNSGGNTDSGLYFELRHRGQPIDPLTWVEMK